MLPTTTPTTISMSATEMPTRMEIKLAMNASPIQMAAINQMLSVIRFFLLVLDFVRLRRRGRFLLRRQIRVGAVINHLHLFERHETAAHHAVEDRKEGVDFLLAVHDFDDQ